MTSAPWPLTVAVLTKPPHRPRDVSMKSVRNTWTCMPPIARWARYRGRCRDLRDDPQNDVEADQCWRAQADREQYCGAVVEHNDDAGREASSSSRVEKTTGRRSSAKRLLPIARAAGYEGSARNFRRLVAEVKAGWRAKTTTGEGARASGRLVTCWSLTGARSGPCSSFAPCWPGAGFASCGSSTTSVPRRPWRGWLRASSILGAVSQSTRSPTAWGA